MKIGFDIGGVISKYPNEFQNIVRNFCEVGNLGLRSYAKKVYIITDQHPKEQVWETLKKNSFDFLRKENIYCADYEQYGNMAKAILIKELGLDIFIDDFDGYLQWDSSLGPQPILLKVQPDNYKPYWHDSWKCDGGDFGRRKYSN